MKILTYNLNGIRAALKKDLQSFLQTHNFDIICFQETKATKGDVDEKIFFDLGYPYHYWFSANKKGYSGVAVFCKEKPKEVKYGSGYEQSDFEGRVLQLHFKDFVLINCYFPSGTSGDERQTYKYQFLDEMFDYVNELKTQHKKIILLGDYNIAHTEIDIHDPKGNKNTSGFLPQEREWLTKFIDSGWIDTTRHFNPEPGVYTWWSQRFPTVRLQNKGWRIDYIMATKDLQKKLKGAGTLPNDKQSDHCGLWLEM